MVTCCFKKDIIFVSKGAQLLKKCFKLVCFVFTHFQHITQHYKQRKYSTLPIWNMEIHLSKCIYPLPLISEKRMTHHLTHSVTFQARNSIRSASTSNEFTKSYQLQELILTVHLALEPWNMYHKFTPMEENKCKVRQTMMQLLCIGMHILGQSLKKKPRVAVYNCNCTSLHFKLVSTVATIVYVAYQPDSTWLPIYFIRAMQGTARYWLTLSFNYVLAISGLQLCLYITVEK